MLSTESLCAMDCFAIERLDPIPGHEPILQEQYRQNAEEILDAILLELSASNIPLVLYNEMLGGVTDYLHSNFKLRYDILSARLLDDISVALGFNTMAYKEAWEYAKITHTHPGEYSHLKCKAAYTKDQVVKMGAQDKEDFT